MNKGKAQAGFSLIELMMVVVIIGVLAGVGIPQYQKFQMKARQSEAKSLLSGMYTAQKAFYAEWNQYYTDFNAVGYGLSGNLGYNVGFTAAGVNGPVTHPNVTYANSASVVRHAGQYCAVPANGCTRDNARSTLLVVGTQATALLFTFGAAANLDDDISIDQWTLDQTKTFSQVVDDISI